MCIRDRHQEFRKLILVFRKYFEEVSRRSFILYLYSYYCRWYLVYSSTSFCFIQWCSHVTGNVFWRGMLWNVDASISCIRSQCSVALLMDHTPWLWYVRRRNMYRLACNICGVTAVMSARVLAVVSRQGAHSLWSLPIVQVQQVSLHSFGYCTCSVWTMLWKC